MKSESAVSIGAFLLAFSIVCDGLAIGFEVDTPLDPFLGGLSKMKRHIIRRVKELGGDGGFANGSPIDQLNMIFGQPQTPIAPFQFAFPAQTSQPAVTTQLPFTTIDQRKVGFNQIPPPVAQAMDAQLMTFLNQGATKRGGGGLPYPSLPGLRQVPGILQQLTQALPVRSYAQCSVPQQKQSFY